LVTGAARPRAGSSRPVSPERGTAAWVTALEDVPGLSVLDSDGANPLCTDKYR